MRILIVDDHPIIIQAVRRLLEIAFPGSSFGAARTFNEAAVLVESEKWDAVILDIVLPGCSGLSLLDHIRQKHQALPVVIYSVHSEIFYAMRAFRSGASGYLSKECAPDQLVDAVRKVLDGKKYVTSEQAEHLASGLDVDALRSPNELLSKREFEVLYMIASGKNTTAIADELQLSVKTVSTYRSRILTKLRLHSTADLVRYALETGIDYSSKLHPQS